MNLRTEWFLALRYFKPKRNAVSVITLISILGVTLGVAVLIVVLAVMTGFTDMMKQKLLETTAHIQIMNYGRGYIADPAKIVKEVNKLGAEATPVVSAQVLIQRDERFMAKLLIGIDPDDKVYTKKFGKYLQKGKFQLEKNEVLVSTVIANELGTYVGDKILIHSPAHLAKMVEVDKKGKVKVNKKSDMYLPSEFVVSGIYSFGKYDFDQRVLFVNMDDADDIFDLPWGAATNVFVWTEDPFNLSKLMRELCFKFPDLNIFSWKEMNRKLLGVLAVEKNMMFFLLVFIVLVAAFSITNTLITVVVQKTREIGLLKSLGSSSGTIMRVFIMQGFLVGLLGDVFGITLGVAVVYWRNSIMRIVSKFTGMELFPKEFYYFNELPAAIVVNDLLVIAVISLVLCTLGAVIPAFSAAKLDPAKALRYE